MEIKISLLILIFTGVLGIVFIIFAVSSYDDSLVYDLDCYDKQGNEIQGIKCKGYVGFSEEERIIIGMGVLIMVLLFWGMVSALIIEK